MKEPHFEGVPGKCPVKRKKTGQEKEVIA